MRSIAITCCLLLGMATAAAAQATPTATARRGDVALAYHWVHTNAPPNGGCGCFGLNGLGISASYSIRSQLAIVAEVSADHTAKALAQAQSLTLISYMAGARYRPFAPRMDGSHQIQPFAQVLVGGAHAGGGIAGVADGTSALATRVGGGVDIPAQLRRHGSSNPGRILYDQFLQHR